MLIGRREELAKLEKLRQSGSFQLPAVYGRRRVGKTALIRQFIQDKETIFLRPLNPASSRTLKT